MGLFEHWPYVNFHDLNLDWIIKEFPKLYAARDEAQSSAEASAESAAASQLSADASQDSAESSQQYSNDSQEYANDSANSALESQEHAESTASTASQLRNEMSLLDTRMDNILVSGTPTQGNAELIDIRVGANEITYPTAGDAVRGQYNELKDALRSIPKTEPVDITPTTNNKYIKNSDGTIVDAGSVSYYISSELNVEFGERYRISLMMRFNNAVVAFYDSVGTFISTIPASNGTADGSNYIFTNYEFTVPANASKMIIGFYTYEFDVQKVYQAFSSHPAWYGKKWACLGDSLTAENTATTKHYFDYVAEDTGIVPINLGVNGTGYARSSASGDPFYNRIDTIPTDSDVVTIFGSFNDIGSGLEFGDVDDTGTETIAGCINTTITNLQTRIPLVNLGIVAPTPWDTTRPNFVPTSNSYKYVNLLKMICERRSIPFLDLWHCSNLRPWDADFRAIAYSNDGGSGTHPDENGHKLIAPRFEWFLSSLLLG